MMPRMPWKTSTTQKLKDGQSDWNSARAAVAEETEAEETQVGLCVLNIEGERGISARAHVNTLAWSIHTA